MILFKDGLKFRGIYVHNLENDQVIVLSVFNFVLFCKIGVAK